MKEIVEKIIDNCQDDYTVNELENIQDESKKLFNALERGLLEIQKIEPKSQLEDYVSLELEKMQIELAKLFNVVEIREEMDIESKEYERTFG